MKKEKKKRSEPGKFITQNRLPKEKPSLGEIAKGQKEYDVRHLPENFSGSAYWDWMEKHGLQTEDGEIIESPQANPDVLAEGQQAFVENDREIQDEYTLARRAINTVLTEKQRHIMLLVIDGFSRDKIAHNLGISEGAVGKHIKASRIKIQEYLDNNGY